MAHQFALHVVWKEGLQWEARPQDGGATVPFSVPPQFGGTGDRWTPEHFFAAAVNSCVAATFLIHARQSELSLRAYESTAEATMEKTPDGLRLTQVVVRPRIRVAEERDRERAERMVDRAEAKCPISNSITSEVVLDATVEVGE